MPPISLTWVYPIALSRAAASRLRAPLRQYTYRGVSLSGIRSPAWSN